MVEPALTRLLFRAWTSNIDWIKPFASPYQRLHGTQPRFTQAPKAGRWYATWPVFARHIEKLITQTSLSSCYEVLVEPRTLIVHVYADHGADIDAAAARYFVPAS